MTGRHAPFGVAIFYYAYVHWAPIEGLTLDARFFNTSPEVYFVHIIAATHSRPEKQV